MYEWFGYAYLLIALFNQLGPNAGGPLFTWSLVFVGTLLLVFGMFKRNKEGKTAQTKEAQGEVKGPTLSSGTARRMKKR